MGGAPEQLSLSMSDWESGMLQDSWYSFENTAKIGTTDGELSLTEERGCIFHTMCILIVFS